MREWRLILSSPQRTEAFGYLLGSLLEQSLVLWLGGDLGAGKTCLTRGLARGLGVPGDEPVTSPSYTLMNRYEGRLALHHFDLYRLTHSDELFDLGFEEVLHGEGVTVVEWADRFPDLAQGGLRVELDHCGETCRSATLQALDPAAERLVEQLAGAWPQKEEQP